MLVVFGSINADLFFNVGRLPVRGETVLCPGFVFSPGSKGANQAAAAARAGAQVAMIARVGRDPFARPVVDALAAAGVDVSGIAATDGVTGTAAVMVEPGGENQIVVASGANLMARADDVADSRLGPDTTLVLQMEVPTAENAALIARAKARGCRVVLNLAPAGALDVAALAALDVLVVNQGEADALAGAHAAAEAHARAFHQRWGVAAVVTLGARGAVLADAGGVWRLGALEVDAIDTVGAGDAFVGVLAAALDAGADIRMAAARATVAAGLKCLAAGAQAGLPGAAAIDAALPRLAPARRLG